jgi:uncharacterized protein (DUF2344 family)
MGGGQDQPQRVIGPATLLILLLVERIGRLAYRLDLPSSWTQKGIHPVISIAHLEPVPSGYVSWKRQTQQEHTPTFDEDSHMTQTAMMSNA